MRNDQATPTRRRRGSAKRVLNSPWGLVFIAPALVIFAVFSIGPTIYTFFVSFYHFNQLNPKLSRFVGAKNYTDAWAGRTIPSFWKTMGVSLYFVIAMVVVGTLLSLFIAALMERSTRFLVATRTSVFLAHVTPLVATSLIWVWIFNPRYGLLNVGVKLLGFSPVDWLGNEKTAMLSVIIYTLWHDVGFTTIIFIGGMTTLSKQLHEASLLDGCGPWREFFYVSLPQLKPYVIFVIVTSSVYSLHGFTQFFVLTGGGPDYATATLGFQLYQQAFVVGNTGYAAALAIVLFAICIVLSLAQLKAGKLMRGANAS